MAIYDFDSISAAQALSITAADTITTVRVLGSAHYPANIEYLAATATSPVRISVEFGSHAVVFNTNIEALSRAGRFYSNDGFRLTIGKPGGDTITGDSFNRSIYGLSGDDKLTAGGQGDWLLGGAGADTLASGAGDDTLQGGDGDDRLIVGYGPDSFTGDAGFDTAVFDGQASDFMIVPRSDGGLDIYDQRLSGTAGNLTTLSGVERLQFTDRSSLAGNLLILSADTDIEGREGDSGLTAHHFHVARQGDLSSPLTVTWRATSTTGADFQQSSGQVTFAANSANADFILYTVADTVVENDETFEVYLEPTGSWTVAGGSVLGRDINDDGRANTFSIANRVPAPAEGHSGSSEFTFTITRGGYTAAAGTVSYSVSGSGAQPAGPADFVGGAFPSGTVQFAAGETSKTLTIHVQGDATVEPDEGFAVTLQPYTFGDQIGTATATAVIYNDEIDRPPSSGGGGGSPSSPAPNEPIVGGSGSDTIQGTTGNDTINGGDGTSYLRGAEGNDVIAGGADFDDINGNMGDDTTSGGLGDDWVVGGKDNDSLSGDGGNDIVYGNLGSDYCSGGDGDDLVRGGQGNDVVLGGAGADWLSGDRGDDTVTGGAGADTFHTFGEAGIDRVTDFNLAEGDRVQLDPGTTYALSQVGADTVIDMGGGGQMVLVGVSMASLTGGWIFTA